METTVERRGTHYITTKLSYMLTLLLMKWGRSLPDLRDDGGGVLVVGNFHVNGFQHLLCVCIVLDPFQEGEPPWTAGHLDRGRTRYTNMHTHKDTEGCHGRNVCHCRKRMFN